MNAAILIFLGGGAGAVLRHFSNLGAQALLGPQFPYGTMFVNVAGSLLIGMIMEAVAMKANISGPMQMMLVTGVLGGFTTFSAFSFDIFRLTETGQMHAAAGYIFATVFLSMLGVYGGTYLMRGLLA